MHTDPSPIVVFGKLPAHGDFVRHGAGGGAARALDRWLQQGLQVARERLRNAFDSAYAAASACHVLFSPEEGDHALIGTLQPSRDRSGRTYPLFAGQKIDRRLLGARPEGALLAPFVGFLEQALLLTRAAAADRLDQRALARRLEPVRLPDGLRARSAYEQHLRQTTVSAFSERLWAHAAPARMSSLIENLKSALLPVRDASAAGPRYGLKFPLRPECPTYDADFWLDVCQRLRGEATGVPTLGVPTLFWTVPETHEEVPCFLLMFAHAPPASLFVHLLPVAFESDRIWAPAQMNGEPSAGAGAADATVASATAADAARTHAGHRREPAASDPRSLWDVLHELP